jgi:hypothetical protein
MDSQLRFEPVLQKLAVEEQRLGRVQSEAQAKVASLPLSVCLCRVCASGARVLLCRLEGRFIE